MGIKPLNKALLVCAGLLLISSASVQAHQVIRYHHSGVTIVLNSHYDYYKAPRVIHRPIRTHRHHVRHGHHWRHIPRHYRHESKRHRVIRNHRHYSD